METIRLEDENLEREVLTFIFNSSDGFGKTIKYNITHNDFKNISYKRLYSYIAKYYIKNHVVPDKLTILEELEFSDDNIKIQFEAELDRLMRQKEVPNPRFEKKLLELRDYTIKRKWMDINEEITETIKKGDVITGVDIAKKYSDELSVLLLQNTLTDIMNLDEGFERFLKQLEQKRSGERIVSYKTGYKDIDDQNLITNGLTYILGRPGSGKTLVADNFSLNMVNLNQPVALITAEMNNIEHLERMISQYTQIEYQKVIMGDISAADEERILKARQELKDKPLYFLFNADFAVKEIVSYIRWYHEMADVNVFFIDYFQLLKGFEEDDVKWKKDKQTIFSEISTAFRILTAQLEISIICLAQASKRSDRDKDSNKRIQLGDMRWTDQAVQDAINVISLYNDEQWHGDKAENKGFIEFEVLKARKAKVGNQFKLRYDAVTQCLMNPVGVDSYNKSDLKEVGIVLNDDDDDEEVIDLT